MTTVFLSGSRGISRLNDQIRSRLRNIVGGDFRVLVGDANGADKAIQRFLSDQKYENVVVFCSGGECRNNVANWPVRAVAVDANTKGRDFYSKKDREMACEADYGLILWDGKSSGSVNNALELLKRHKKAVMYFAPEKKFYNVSRAGHIRELLAKCDRKAVESIQRKINLNGAIRAIESSYQGVLSF